MKKSFLLKMLSLLISFVLLSCGEGETIDKGTIRLSLGPEPATMDPAFNSVTDVGIYISHMFEGLTTADKEGKITYGVAQNWDISDDGLTYIFYIRNNAKWSDGEPVTANDFVYSWRRVVDPVTASPSSHQLAPIKNATAIEEGSMPVDSLGVVAIDEKTLRVTLEVPTPYFLDLLNIYTYYPVRRDIIEEYGDKWTLVPLTYIGNGAFKMTERSIDDKIVMERNENYWDIDRIVPNKLVFLLMQNDNAIIAGLKEGSLYFADNPPHQDVPNLVNEGIAIINPVLGTYYYVASFTNEATKDSRVRKALSLAIDRNYIVEQVLRGGQKPASAWISYGVLDFEGDFRENGGDYYSVSPDDYEANVAEAKELLIEAGYPNGEGLPVLEFKTNPGAGHSSIFEAIQQMWKENLGIDSIMSQEEWAVFQQTRYDRNFVIARHGYSGNYNDPISFIDLFVSDSFQNTGSYSNAKYDEIVKRAKLIVNDEEARMQALHEAEAILFEDTAIIPIYFYTQPILINPKLKDVVYDPFARHRFDYAYIEE